MSHVILIRHAQASLFRDDYDQLSEIGMEQSRRLGALWRKSGFFPDAIVTGPRRRQRQTAELALEVAGLKADQWEWPEFDEVRFDALLHPAWRPTGDASPEIWRRFAKLQQSTGPEARLRNFQWLAEEVASAWQTGRYLVPEAEAWEDFVARVRRGLQRLRHEFGRGKTVAVFTSAGPIAVALQQALECPPSVVLELLWQVRNASITELLQSDERMSMRQFNAIPHLAEPQLITFR